MIEAMIGRQRNPGALAQLARGIMRNKTRILWMSRPGARCRDCSRSVSPGLLIQPITCGCSMTVSRRCR